ncbi:HD-domain/PDEase-like protein [Piedraia hortae CBS 480.64]|uniref:Phosphodiesterase n=1 Tax=Piedraia hortae CBS 480.64 TaxID=1314780 RepID=A0A6A7BTG7_9PEZI|nr:HD-domain/PDEase-like protein [Piedraia hortae CBS 480.64]
METAQCGLVYLTPAASPSAQLYTPDTPVGHDNVGRNLQILLDRAQGGFHQVFVCSSTHVCLQRLDADANYRPTVALCELDVADDDALLMLRGLTDGVRQARWKQRVMPFALLQDATKSSEQAHANVTATCLEAGAVDVLRSPLGVADVKRLVGHAREARRPCTRLVGANMAEDLVNNIPDAKASMPAAAQRPDLMVPEGRKRAVESAVGLLQFPACDFDMDELTYAALYMLEHVLRVPSLEPYALPRDQLMGFLLDTRRQYRNDGDVPYHNWRHAVDVTQTIYRFLAHVQLCPPLNDTPPPQLNGIERLMTPIDALTLLVAAIGHDVGHPGVNNAFLVACEHPLALLYNDKSVLENYHCAAFSLLLRKHWPSLSSIPSFRSSMISTILATDMQRHFEYMNELTRLTERLNETESLSPNEEEHARTIMMALLIKAADISNVARPFDISSRWARILLSEFARQGELEVEMGIPTCLFGGPPKPNDDLAAAQSQKGFMSLFGLPLFRGIKDLMPSFSCLVGELENNRIQWDLKISEEQGKMNLGENLPMLASVDEMRPISEPVGMSSRMRARTDLNLNLSSPPPVTVLASPTGCPSRRSSKDVALDQLQQLSMIAQHGLSPTGRRGSADAGWPLNPGFTGARRRSKDESFTTIVLAGPQSPRPSSPARTLRSSDSAKQSRHTRKQSSRSPLAPTHSYTTSSGTAATTHRSSISTRPSSISETTEMVALSPCDDDSPAKRFLDNVMLAAPLTPEPPRIAEEEEFHGRSGPGTERRLGQSRSRSRLRNLKFWRWKREEANEGGSP